MIIKWLPDAELDLDEIYDFIAEDDPDAAARQIERILAQVGRLTKKVSRKGRGGRVPETMELVIIKTPFIVVYRTMPGRYEILRVLHASQQWPKSLG